MKYEYDLLVIGGGAAGLTAAGIGANFGAKTLLVESQKLGGDCTWHGCIPSKTLLHTSKLAHNVNEAKRFGFEGQGSLDFSMVMQHIRNTRQEVYEDADDPNIFRDMGVDVDFGHASFVDDHTITIATTDGKKITSARFIIIATGSKVIVPPINGLSNVPYHTNETIFELEEQPQQLAIIGAGPIGIEMAQAFQRLGTQVTVFDMQDRILSSDDTELTDMLCDHLKSEGVRFKLDSQIQSVSQGKKNNIVVSGTIDGASFEQITDNLLIATGRVANYHSLDLDKAGINYTKKGITVDDRCRTNKRHIYAAGDVTGHYQFTHMSEHMAKIATTNALLKMPMKIDKAHVTWSTFTDPELAHVGATEKELQQQNISYKAYRFPYNKIDRAITDGATKGLIKIFTKKISGKILGATILGKQGGDLISEYAVAMRNGVTLRQIADTIHPYPSYGLGARRAADQWYIQNQSTWMIKLIKWVFGYRGEVPDLSDENRIL